MRSIFAALAVLALLISCSNANNDKKAEDGDSAQNAGATHSEPRTIINAIAGLRTILESKNKQEIAGLIDFPVPDTVLEVHLDDSAFQESYRAAGDKLTRAMFLDNFDKIARYTYLDKITDIFQYIPFDSLRYTNELEKRFADEKMPCSPYYSISREENLVTLFYGTHANSDYVKRGDPAETTMGEAGCEYGVFWVFKFDGNRLRLSTQGSVP
jgi:hypothetical protein